MLVAGEARRGWETGERLGGPSWWQEFYCPLSELKCVLWPPEALVRAWRGQLTGPASQASWCRELGQPRPASLLTSVDASLKWQPVKRRHKCERNFGDFRHE